MDPITAGLISILGKYAIDKGAELAREVGPTAVEKVGELFRSTMRRLRKDPAGEVIAEGFEQDPDTYAKPMEKKLTEKMEADEQFAAEIKELFAQYEAAARAYSPGHDIDVGSGAAAVGDNNTVLGERAVHVGGDNVGNISTGDNNEITTTTYNYYGRRDTPDPAEVPARVRQTGRLLRQYFSTSELKTLSFDLGVTYEDLPSDTRSDLAQSLALYCHRAGKLDDLLKFARRERNHVDWPA